MPLKIVTYLISCIVGISISHADKQYLQPDEKFAYIDYNCINDFVIDGDRVWCGCMGGVVRWDISDGTYEIFTEKDGLLHREVSALAMDSENRLWIGYRWDRGISCFSGSEWISHDFAESVNDILIDRSGTMWFGEAYGLSVYDGTVWEKDDTVQSVISIVQDADQTIWLGAEHSILSKETDGWIQHESGIDSPIVITDIAFDRNNTLWVSALRGLHSYDGSVWTSHQNDFENLFTTSVDTYDTTVWVGSNRGLFRYDGSAVDHYTVEDGLPDDFIRIVVCDSTGCVWLATGAGLVRFDGDEFRLYKVDMPGNMFDWSVAVDHDNVRWFTKGYSGPTDKTVYRNDGSGLEMVKDGGSSGYAFCVLVDGNNNKWFGTQWGVAKYDGSFWKRYRQLDGLIDDYVVASGEDMDGVLWFGTNKGVSRFDGRIWRNYNEEDGLVSTLIRTISCDYDGYVWCGTPEGITMFDGVMWRNFTEADGLVSDRVYASAVDHDNVKWFGTRFGVSSFDGENWTTYTENDGLVFDSINDICVDDNNSKWFATDRGVSRFDGRSWHRYTADDGLPSDIVHSLAVDNDNIIRLMTHGGEASIQNGEVPVDSHASYPEIIGIDGVYPNPFNAATTVRFTLPYDAEISLDIYNIAGQKIRTLADGRMTAGTHYIRWNGSLDSGGDAASGLYIARLRAGNKIASLRMLLVR